MLELTKREEGKVLNYRSRSLENCDLCTDAISSLKPGMWYGYLWVHRSCFVEDVFKVRAEQTGRAKKAQTPSLWQRFRKAVSIS
jgi:hypothetical protein